jgi:phage recombination protein Bet
MNSTGNAIATRNGTVSAHQQAALAISPGQAAWDDTQLAALAQLGIKDASEGDRAVFLHVCQRTGLDPFSRQIYMIGRPEKQSNGQWGKKWTIQTGIDGFRVNRARAEAKAGVRGILSRPVFYDTDGNEHKVWVQRLPPVACEITYTVRDANGTETPYTSILRFAEYVQMKDGKAIAQWAPDAKPVHMLEKCTEADVYRKAFPQDFAGVQLDDAMPLPDPDAPQAAAERPRVTADQARARAQQVRATVVKDPPGGDAPFPGDAAPARPAERAAAHPGQPEDARDAVTWHLDRVGIVAYQGQMDVLTQHTGRVITGHDGLTGEEAAKLAGQLARCQSKDDVDVLLKTGEVPSGGE